MFIAFTNLYKLYDVEHRTIELDNGGVWLNLIDETQPFLILDKINGWSGHQYLPENFKNAAAIICFDFYDCEIDTSISQDLKNLISDIYDPYVTILYHINQHKEITQLIVKNRPPHSSFYSYPDIHNRNSKYKIVIDLLLDAPKINCSNHKFVHDKTKSLRAKRIESEIYLLITDIEIGRIPNKLSPILSMHETKYQNFLNEIDGNYDLNNESHIKKLEEFELLLEEDEYHLTNPQD